MTIAPVSNVLTEFCGGTSATMDIAMMIGVGLQKDSDAVYFQYLGEEQKPRPLIVPATGKPVFKFMNVKLVGIDVADGIGEFNATKLNLYLESSEGSVVLVTSGLSTLWSQFVVAGLMGLYNEYGLADSFNLTSWKGTSAYKPCFAQVQKAEKVVDQQLTDQLKELRADRAQDKVLTVMRDSVDILRHALGIQEADVVVDEAPAALPETDF